MGSLTKDLYKNILREEELSNIKDFICRNVTFEEIPLVNRYDSLRFLKNHILLEDYSVFLLNTAFFCLNNIFFQMKKLLPKEEYDDYFACITLCDPREEMKDIGFIVPHIFVSRKSKVLFLDEALKVSVETRNFLEKVYCSLLNCNGSLSLYESITKTNFDSISRIYIEPEQNRKCVESVIS